jgi:membrane-associated protease RseP (regulator of RpoE activity)
MANRGHPRATLIVPAAFVGLALLFGASVLAVRSVRVATPASHDARTLLKLDSALGATLEPLDSVSARVLGGGSEVDDMVVTSVASGGRAAAAGIRVGDVVEEISGKDPSDLDAAAEAIGPAAIPVAINRHGHHIVVELPAPSAPRG